MFSPMRNRKLPSALLRTTITVCGSGALTLLMLSNTAFFALLVDLALARSKLRRRRWLEGLAVVELHALFELEGVDLAVGIDRPASASSGVILPSMLILVRPSSTLMCTTSPIAAAGAIVGSRPGAGSSTMPRTTLSCAPGPRRGRRPRGAGRRQGQDRGGGGGARGDRTDDREKGSGNHRAAPGRGVRKRDFKDEQRRGVPPGARRGACPAQRKERVERDRRRAAQEHAAPQALRRAPAMPKPWPEQAETKVIAVGLRDAGRTRNKRVGRQLGVSAGRGAQHPRGHAAQPAAHVVVVDRLRIVLGDLPIDPVGIGFHRVLLARHFRPGDAVDHGKAVHRGALPAAAVQPDEDRAALGRIEGWLVDAEPVGAPGAAARSGVGRRRGRPGAPRRRRRRAPLSAGRDRSPPPRRALRARSRARAPRAEGWRRGASPGRVARRRCARERARRRRARGCPARRRRRERRGSVRGSAPRRAARGRSEALRQGDRLREEPRLAVVRAMSESAEAITRPPVRR